MTTTPPSPSAPLIDRITDRVWGFFSDVKLALTLIIAIATTSIIGTIIPQMPDTAQLQRLVQQWGPERVDLYLTLGFFDMYHALWFQIIIALFCINIVVCSIDRIPLAWRRVMDYRPVLTEQMAAVARTKQTIELPQSVSRTDVVEAVAERLTTKFSSPAVNTDAEGAVHVFSNRGPQSRLGPYVIHLGLLVIILGALIGNVWGFQGFMSIEEGTWSDRVTLKMDRGVIQLPFRIYCEDFVLEKYPGTDKPKLFRSDLKVLQGDAVVHEQRIIVNDPMEYGGMTFYQASFGETDNPNITVRAERPDGSLIERFTTPLQQPLWVDDVGLFMALRHTDNFEGFGPAILVALKPADTPDLPPAEEFPDDFEGMLGLLERAGLITFPVLTKPVPIFESDIVPQAGARFILENVETTYYTGIQVTKDPGVGTVWVGSAMVMLGLGMALFWSHRRIWARIESNRLTIVGNASKNRLAFERDFAALVADLKGRYSQTAAPGA